MELWLALTIMWCLGGVANYMLTFMSIRESVAPEPQFLMKYFVAPVVMMIGGWVIFAITVRSAWDAIE